jgi:hypothetical protein
MVDSGFNSPAYSSSLRNSETRTPETGEATVISARFSSRDLLTVHLVADRLLTDCWTKACEFARNFNALHIDIDHLLLGASHVRDAESALSAVCDDVEVLTHELARICARRSFADVPEDNEAYEASQGLRIILCEASALAARQGVPNLTLSLVIEALAKTEPQPAVIEVLPKLRRRAEAERAEQAEHVQMLSAINRKIDGLNAVFSPEFRERLGTIDTVVAQAIAAQIAPLEARLDESVGQRMEHVIQLTHKQSVETRDQVYEAVRVLPNMVANMVGERVAELDAPKDQDKDQTRRWFHFWRGEDGSSVIGEPPLSRTWSQVKRTVSFKRPGNN